MKTQIDNPNAITIISRSDVTALLRNQEQTVLDIVREAYIAHYNGETSIPFSTFLRFAKHPKDRIIGLPAYLYDGITEMAGIKWVASFPDNIHHGFERASASIFLNSMQNGRVYSVLEASMINIHRTAASAFLALELLANKQASTLTCIGAGPVNEAICSYAIKLSLHIKTIRVYDVDTTRSNHFAKTIRAMHPKVVVKVCKSLNSALSRQSIISFATNTTTPYIDSLHMTNNNCLILHISLRDLSPTVLNDCQNIVDDIAHVNRENTSIQLAFQKYKTLAFITSTIGKLCAKKGEVADLSNGRIIYSPFGLGVLDINVATYIYREAKKQGRGEIVKNYY